MPSTKESLGVVVEGQKLTVSTFNGKAEVTIKAACENKNDGQWYCSTHDEGFDNQLQKDFHISDGKPHVLAWNCRHHGVEAP